MGQANLSDIVDNQGPATPATAAPVAAGGTAQLSDIVDNQGPETTPPAPPTTTENIVGGLGDTASDVWGAVKAAPAGIWHAIEQTALHPTSIIPNAVAHPVDTLHTDVQKALPIINAYETARSSGKGVIDSLSAADETARGMGGITGTIAQKLADLKANPTREGVRDLGDTVAALTAAYGLGKAGEALIPGEEGAAAAATTPAAPEAEAVGSPSWLQKMNPFRPAAATPADTAAATSKIEPAVEARTAKAGLAPGEAGLTPAEASAKTTQARLDAQAATQANVDKTVQDIATQHAQANGLPTPAAGTPTRDILTANGDALVDAGRANYKILDQYTDGRFTNAQNELKNAQQELRTKAGMTDADSADLEANVTRAQWNVEHLFDEAVKKGMPKDTADLARTQFRTGQATLDAANDVRMANKVNSAGVRTTNLSTLENRWTARYDSGRLQQAFGKQGAKDALVQLHAARETADTIAAMPPTESKALQELIARNTETGGLRGATTNWKGVRKDFSALPDRAARFSDVPKVEKFINRQNLYQTYRTSGTLAGLAVAAHVAGIDKFLLHLMLGE